MKEQAIQFYVGLDGAKHWASVDEACHAVVRAAKRVAPDVQNSAVMQKNYATFRRVHAVLRSWQ